MLRNFEPVSQASPNPALEQFIRSIPLFSLVAPPEMMDILRLLRPVELEAGKVLFREGEPGKAMWVMGRGDVYKRQISLGVADMTGDMTEPLQFIKGADANLYKAKKTGRNRTHG